MSPQEIVKILEENIRRIEKCKEKDCNINRKYIIAIFSSENDGIKNGSIKRELITSDGNYKACDCIVVCTNGDIYIIEILCGILTRSELTDKVEQVENCITVLKILNLYNYLALSFILFERKDRYLSSGPGKKYLQQKSGELQRKKIFLKQFNELNENFPCYTGYN